ncbi:MAG: helix-turn-helix transcriptional regulator [Planctomycetes bacterium]|nr:helix-turn-helix transcriptional regulator [Planctomycetota bacterium]
MDITKDLVAASATPLILSILSEGESYGYAIIKRVAELSGGKMKWTDGMLYPILHRLEKQGLIQSQTRTSETSRKRKYYYLKQDGAKAVKNYQNQWQDTYATLLKVWEDKPCLQ